MGADGDRAAGGGEPEGVVEQVVEHLVEPLPVGPERREASAHIVDHLDRPFRPGHADLGDDLVDQLPEGDRLELEGDVAGLEAGQVEQLVHEAGQALALREHHRQHPGVRLLDPVQQVLEMGLQRRDRRLQLVRDVAHELPPACLDSLELGGHPVEGARELAHLVPGAGRHPVAVVPLRHPPGGRRHLPERRRHAPREEPGDDEGNGSGDRPGHEELPPESPQEVRSRRERAGAAAGGRADVDRPRNAPAAHHGDPHALQAADDAGVDGAGDRHACLEDLALVIDDEYEAPDPGRCLGQRCRPVALRVEGLGGEVTSRAQRLAQRHLPFGVAEGEANEHVERSDGDQDREDGDRPQLDPDGRQAVERPDVGQAPHLCELPAHRLAHSLASRNV